MTLDLLLPALFLLPLHSLAVAGLWRAAYFAELPSRDPRGWPSKLPLEAVDVLSPSTGVLWPLRWAAERYLPAWLQRPLIVCPACMATVWGPLPYLALLGTAAPALLLYLLYWPALSALASVWARVVNPEP